MTGIVTRATAGIGSVPSQSPESGATLACGHSDAVSGCDSDRCIRLLVLTSLYPNAAQPRHGVFVEERLRKLVAFGGVSATVVAPVPWFPFKHPRFGAYANYAKIPRRERRFGIDIYHPRYPVIPKLGMNFAPALMARALLPVLRKLQTTKVGFDLIDAHYFYPDGVAAARLGKTLGKSVVITARGSDVTVISNYRRPRQQILWAARQAASVVSVSRALKDKASSLGIDPGKITVLRNGVDVDLFKPRERAAIRMNLGLSGPVWLTVGNLIELKGVHIAIKALAQVPDVTLLIAGDGPDARRLRNQVRTLDVGTRVRFLGVIRHDRLCEYYNAADALIHASSHEGMPNVVLESLACGTPVVAAPFAGVEELVNAPEAGEVAEARTADAMLAAWHRLSQRQPDRAATRRFAERLGWAPVVEAQHALYARVLAAGAPGMRTQGKA